MTVFFVRNESNRIFGLDILRALAIFFVILGHSAYLLPVKKREFIFSLPLPDGVSIFFVLSGFLIGGILIKILENGLPTFSGLIVFWKRRWLRTLPLYYLVLITLLSLSKMFVEGFEISNVTSYFYFGQNLVSSHPPFFIEAWSLSVEEWFYLLIPGLIFVLTGVLKLTPRKAIEICIILIVFGTAIFRYYRYLTIPVINEEVWDAVFRRQVVTRLDSLMFGVAGAYLYYYHPILWIKYKNIAFLFGLAGMVLIDIVTRWIIPKSVFYFCNLSFICTSTAVLLLLPFLSQLKRGSGYFYRLITFISLISYSLYLTHASFMMQWVMGHITFRQSGSKLFILMRYGLFWIFSIGLSTLLYKYIEIPFMALRDKKRIDT